MTRFPNYKDYSSQDAYDKKQEQDFEERMHYNMATRCGLDDPLKMSLVDYNTRMNLVFTILVAYDVKPDDFIEYMEMLFPVIKK